MDKKYLIVFVLFLVSCSNQRNEKDINCESIADSKLIIQQVKKQFFQQNELINKRELNKDKPNSDSGLIIKLGDINNDKRIDAVLEYSLIPTSDDNNSGGNAVKEITGFIVYIQEQNKTFSFHKVNNDIYGDLFKIKDGFICLRVLEYGPDDPFCCPSIEKIIKMKIQNDSLIEVK